VITADLIVEARRRGGLTQQELAERLGRPQPTIARWDSGRHAPSMETVREVARACGLEFSYGLAEHDDSYGSLIDAQLRLSPAERLEKTCAWSAGVLRDDRPLRGRRVLEALRAQGVDFVLVGHLANALHGSPILGAARHVELVPRPSAANEGALRAALEDLGAEPQPVDEPWGPELDPWQPWRLPDDTHVVIAPRPAATRGYADLRADAVRFDLGEDLSVACASLVDLIRIADRTPRRARLELAALRALRERTRPDFVRPPVRLPPALAAALAGGESA
jgi:transcriptional regulator with XRE-family HTH domain